MRILPTALGAGIGVLASVPIMDAIGVEVTGGIGIDDFVQAIIITAAILLVHQIL